ncbi:hypothetical protein HDV01_000998 [Terramyces sp. JEL0728]|nr:hypothetical protein HDV01_000998 [Terramyces sp. JEL0728]
MIRISNRMIFKNKFGAVVPEMLQVKDCFDSNDCIECIALPMDKVKRKLSDDLAPKKRLNTDQIIPDSQARLCPKIKNGIPNDLNTLLLDKIKANEKETLLIEQIFESGNDSASTASKISGYKSDEDLSETDQTKTSEVQIVDEIETFSDEEKAKGRVGDVEIADLDTQSKELSSGGAVTTQEDQNSVPSPAENEIKEILSQPFENVEKENSEKEELDEEVDFLIRDINLAPTPRAKTPTEGTEPEKKKGRRARKRELLKNLESNSQKRDEEASQMSEVLGNPIVSPVLTSNSKISPKVNTISLGKSKPLKLFGDDIPHIFEMGLCHEMESSEEFRIKSVNMEDTPTQEGLTQTSPIDLKIGGLFEGQDHILDITLPPSKQSAKVLPDLESVPGSSIFNSQPSIPEKPKSTKSVRISSLAISKKTKSEIVNPFSSMKQGQKFRSLSQITAEVVQTRSSQKPIVSAEESSSGESGGDSDSSSESDNGKSKIRIAGKKKNKRRKSMLLELAKEVKPGTKSRRSLPANAKLNK